MLGRLILLWEINGLGKNANVISYYCLSNSVICFDVFYVCLRKKAVFISNLDASVTVRKSNLV